MEDKREAKRDREASLKRRRGEKRSAQREITAIANTANTGLLFAGLGHMILLVIAFMIHPLLGGIYAIYWLFLLPYREIRRLQRRNIARKMESKRLQEMESEAHESSDRKD